MHRTVVVEMWTGARVVQRLGPPSAIDLMSDAEVSRMLRRLGAFSGETSAAARRERLREWPTQADLDAIAAAWTGRNKGVRPVARVLEESSLPGRRRGVAGSVG